MPAVNGNKVPTRMGCISSRTYFKSSESLRVGAARSVGGHVESEGCTA